MSGGLVWVANIRNEIRQFYAITVLNEPRNVLQTTCSVILEQKLETLRGSVQALAAIWEQWDQTEGVIGMGQYGE